LDTQLALMQATNAQTQLNMTLGAQIDQSNYAFNTTQDISKADDAAANLRLQTATEGEQTRANTAATAEQQRTTNLQQEMFRRYQNNLDYNRATDAYHA
jgi:hypothetical protein